MANFALMRDRFLHVLRDNLALFSIRGRFLDYGAGLAHASRFLLDECGMSSGVAYDPGFRDEAVRRDAGAPRADLELAERLALDHQVDLALLLDVVEHVPDAAGTLREIHACVRRDGWLAVIVPYNAHEWGEDDEFYGHLRRLSLRGVVTLLEKNGWNVIRVLDPTFPSFWLARRGYLLLLKLRPRSFALGAENPGSDLDRSLRSPRHVAWNPSGLIPRLLATDLVPWNLVRRFDLYFESVFRGFELFVLCQKREGPNACDVCEHGVLAFHRFFDRYSLQKCGYCGSERILPDSATETAPSAEVKRHAPVGDRILDRLRPSRGTLVLGCDAPEPSLLDVSCGNGRLVAEVARRGWRAVGTASSDEAAAAARASGIEVAVGDLASLPARSRFGVMTLFHVIEQSDLRRVFSCLDRLVMPGGYLILEYPNGSSLLKRLLGWRWFGYDPPYHRQLVDPTFLADRLGVANYRLVREAHFSLEYSYFVFAQSLVNTLLPFQRDALYRVLEGRDAGPLGTVGALLSVPFFVLLLPLFLLYQPLASWLRRGCIVRQVFKRTDIVPVPDADATRSDEEQAHSST